MDKQEVEVSIAEVSKETLEYKEALIFAFLGLLCLQGEANIAQSVTGASQDCIGGSIHLPCIWWHCMICISLDWSEVKHIVVIIMPSIASDTVTSKDASLVVESLLMAAL